MTSRRRITRRLLATVVVAASLVGIRPPAAQAAAFTELTLLNGWGVYSGSLHPAVTVADGVVQFRGAMRTGGTNKLAFTLPVAFRPAVNVYVPVDLCNSNIGRLFIQPNGNTTVQAPNFAAAKCFTSLDGAKFVQTTAGLTTLTPQNGWGGTRFGTGAPRALVLGNIVYLKGAIRTAGSNATAFTFPAQLHPTKAVYVVADLCGGATGRLKIQANGAVVVQAPDFTDAQCFTSLDGVSYSLTAGSTMLTVHNGWTNAPLNTRPASAVDIGGIVHLVGAIKTMTSTMSPFTLPAELSPSTTVYVPADLCGAETGSLIIAPSGLVKVGTTGNFADAQCFTSLDGVTFAI